jgi:CheY-like chemotaxis protein/HPt (histidine-containing phosphotransfer) domain-containing protein
MTDTPTAIDATPISTGPGSFSPGSAGPRATGQIALEGRVLLADDCVDNRQIISLHLRKAGAEVVTAENGRIAVDLARSRPLDLILMDIEMPELDGYAATRQLRASGCTLPIVALTAHTGADDRGECLTAGCTGYLTKPIDKSTLLVSVASYLSGDRSGNAAPAAAPAAAPVARQSSSAGQTLSSAFADDPTMRAPIAEFVDLLPYRVAIMERLLREHNLSELRRVVHQIKGAGGGYGFDAITLFAARVDQLLKQENLPETIGDEVDLLIGLIRSVEGYQLSRERFHV